MGKYKGKISVIVAIVFAAFIIIMGAIIINERNSALLSMIKNDTELSEIAQFMKELQTEDSLVLQNTDLKSDTDEKKSYHNEFSNKNTNIDLSKPKYVKNYDINEVKKIYQINDSSLIEKIKNGKTLNSLIEPGNYSFYVPIENFEDKKGEINIKKSLSSQKFEIRELYIGNAITSKSEIEKILNSEIIGMDAIDDIKYINVAIDTDSFLIACATSELGKEYIVPILKDSDNCPMINGIVYSTDEMVQKMEYYYAQPSE